MRFVIEGRLPGMNEILNTARYNRYAGASQKKKETTRCAMEIIRQTRERFTGPVAVSIAWIEKDLRRDPDNICGGGKKFILDALVETGRIPNDTRQYIHELTDRFPPPDKERPRIEVEVTEIK